MEVEAVELMLGDRMMKWNVQEFWPEFGVKVNRDVAPHPILQFHTFGKQSTKISKSNNLLYTFKNG